MYMDGDGVEVMWFGRMGKVLFRAFPGIMQ